MTNPPLGYLIFFLFFSQKVYPRFFLALNLLFFQELTQEFLLEFLLEFIREFSTNSFHQKKMMRGFFQTFFLTFPENFSWEGGSRIFVFTNSYGNFSRNSNGNITKKPGLFKELGIFSKTFLSNFWGNSFRIFFSHFCSDS